MGLGRMGYLPSSIIVLILIGIAATIPAAYAAEVQVNNAPGSSVPGCEETNECFIPSTVNISIGDTVTWVNDDTAAHTSTSGTAAGGPDGNWDSSLVISGSSFSNTFDQAGEYPYHCMVHPWMSGLVIVQQAQAQQFPPTITVSTDKSLYKENEGMYVTYVISERIPNEELSIRLYDPNDSNISSTIISDYALSLQLTSYTTFLPVDNRWDVGGVYTIIAEYAGSKTILTVDVITSQTNIPQTGTISVLIDGTSYDIDYEAWKVNIISIEPNLDKVQLILLVEVTGSVNYLEITFDREFFDATFEGKDNEFFIIADGDFTDFNEIGSTSISRTLNFELPVGTEEVEIFGTKIAGSVYGGEPVAEQEPEAEPEPESSPTADWVINIPTGAADPNAPYFWQSEKDGDTSGRISIDVFDTVAWVNRDTAAHTVTSGSASEGPDGIFDSGMFGPGKSFSYRFSQSGTYEYFDMLHPWMQGIVIVGGVGSIPPSPPSGPAITVSTDRSSYRSGDFISIFGQVGEILSGFPVTFQLISSNGDIVTLAQLDVAGDGTFGIVLESGGPLWRSSGTYTAKVLYGTQSRTAETTFFFSSGSTTPPITPLFVTTDQSSYQPGNTVKISGDGAAKSEKIIITILSPQGREVIELTTRSTSAGYFETPWKIPSRIESGTYTIRVDDLRNTATTSFRIISDIVPPPPPKPTPTPTPTPTPVTIVQNAPGSSVPGCEETNECFIPNTVTIDVGSTVTWINDDTAAHTSTSGSAADGPDGNWDSSLVIAGSSFSNTFDEAGAFPYFCMVHPWMTGLVLVGEGTSPPPIPPPSNIQISVNTDRALYDLGDLVSVTVKISGISTSQNVAVSVEDPTGKAVVSRTLTTDRLGRATMEFGIHENFKTGGYTVTANARIGGVTYHDTTHFKIESQFDQVRIVSVAGTDQQGNPASFTRGEMGFVKVVVSANKNIAALITVNLFDSELTTIGIASFRTTLASGESEMILSFLIPEDAATGPADIFTNAFSDWPSNGGIPLTGEFSTQVRIT